MLEKTGRCHVIAEIGGNFTTFPEAAALIDAAKASGADCIKLQTFRAETLATKGAMFDMENTGRISQYEFFKRYELSEEDHRKIAAHCRARDIDWFSTPSHETDADLLLRVGVQAWKVGADDLTNHPFLAYLSRTGLPIVLSTGMAVLKEIHAAVQTIRRAGGSRLLLLHTVSGYPTYPEHVNLQAILTLKKEFPGIPVGFSDHTLTPLACIAAAALGADLLEKHFTLDKSLPGPDHRISATPDELRYMVGFVREIEKMRGSGIKEPLGPEIQNRLNNRKSVVAALPLHAGQLLTRQMLTVKRPGSGIPPGEIEGLLGRRLRRDLAQDELLRREDLE